MVLYDWVGEGVFKRLDDLLQGNKDAKILDMCAGTGLIGQGVIYPFRRTDTFANTVPNKHA